MYLYCAGHGENADHRPLLGRRRQQLAVPAEADCHHSAAARHHLVENLQVEGIVQNHLLKRAQKRHTRAKEEEEQEKEEEGGGERKEGRKEHETTGSPFSAG